MFDADGDGIPDTPFNSVSTVDGASVNHVAALPGLTLTFEPDAQHYGWITLARGYLSPGFNTYAISADMAGQPYGAANSSYIELGYRLRGADDTWELGATLFDAYMHDQQITSSLNGQTVTSNAPRSHTRGAELSGRWRPVRQFEFNAFVGLVDAKYDDYTAGGVDYSGRQFASTPRQSFGLGMTWRPDGHWDLGVNVVRQGATNLELLFEGAMYVAIWATLMNWASPERPGADFTAMQCCESVGTAAAAGAIGATVAALGYGAAFAGAWGLAVLVWGAAFVSLRKIRLHDAGGSAGAVRADTLARRSVGG